MIPMTGHTHSLTANEKKEATCTENGYEAFWKCEGCGKFFADAEGKTEIEAPVKIDALGHAYGDWTPAKAPNCTEKGEETRTCSRCGDVETRELPAFGHNYVNGTCTNCGAVDPELICYFRDLDDCPNKWYHEPIDYVYANGLMNGVGDRLFEPEGTMTRAMMVTVLYRMAGSPEYTESSTFTDVASGQYYSTAIAWAQANNIVDGVGEGRFAPHEPVTREQIATILWRYEGKQSASADMSKFNDAGTISNYAREAMAWAVDQGLYIGDAGNLKPTTPATRAEFAMLIMRYRGGRYPCPEIK